MSSTPIANNSLVQTGTSASSVYGGTSVNSNEPLYSPAPVTPSSCADMKVPAKTATPSTYGSNPVGARAAPASTTITTTPPVAPPATFHDATIEQARSSVIKLGIAQVLLGGALFGVMMWTYQSARVAAQMTLTLGIILLAHSASKTAPLMRNKAYGGCCAEVCPWKVLKCLCIGTGIINIISTLVMTILAILSFTVWSKPQDSSGDDKMTRLLTNQICCTVGALLCSVGAIIAFKAKSPCSTIHDRLASLVANGVLVVSFEYMWCSHPYLAPVVTNNNNTDTNQHVAIVATVATAAVDGQQIEATPHSSTDCWNYNQVEVQPIVPMQQEEECAPGEDKTAFSV